MFIKVKLLNRLYFISKTTKEYEGCFNTPLLLHTDQDE